MLERDEENSKGETVNEIKSVKYLSVVNPISIPALRSQLGQSAATHSPGIGLDIELQPSKVPPNPSSHQSLTGSNPQVRRRRRLTEGSPASPAVFLLACPAMFRVTLG